MRGVSWGAFYEKTNETIVKTSKFCIDWALQVFKFRPTSSIDSVHCAARRLVARAREKSASISPSRGFQFARVRPIIYARIAHQGACATQGDRPHPAAALNETRPLFLQKRMRSRPILLGIWQRRCNYPSIDPVETKLGSPIGESIEESATISPSYRLAVRWRYLGPKFPLNRGTWMWAGCEALFESRTSDCVAWNFSWEDRYRAYGQKRGGREVKTPDNYQKKLSFFSKFFSHGGFMSIFPASQWALKQWPSIRPLRSWGEKSSFASYCCTS